MSAPLLSAGGRDIVEQDLRGLLWAMLRCLLDRLGACSITASWPTHAQDVEVLLILIVPASEGFASEKGRVLGRRGLTIQAIRRILTAAGARQGVRVIFDVVDPNDPNDVILRGPEEAP